MMRLLAAPFLLPLLVSGGLIPSFPISIADTSIPPSLAIYSYVVTFTTCPSTTLPNTVKFLQAPDTDGVFIHPPEWQQVQVTNIQDPQVYNFARLQEIAIENPANASDWQLCGMSLQINNQLVYEDTIQVTILSNSTYTLGLVDLQANINWVKTTQICNPPSQFSTYDITLLLTGKIGNIIEKSLNGVDWAADAVGDPLAISLSDTTGYTQAIAQMQYTVNDTITDFSVIFDIIVACGGNELTVQTTNLSLTFVDAANATLYQEVLNLVSPLAQVQSIPASVCPTIAVNSDGSVSFGWPFGIGSLGALCWVN